MSDIRAMCCVVCEGTGHVWEFYRGANYHTGEYEEGWVESNDRCPYCEGTGLELVPVEPIELDDLP